MAAMRALDSIGRDLRFAFRLMRQAPVVSGVAMLSLALGIGANVAIFNLVNALMLKALPIHAPEQLVVLGQPPRDPGQQPNRSFTYPQWEYIRDHQDFFGAVLASGSARFNLNAGGEARPATGLYVNARFFDALGDRRNWPCVSRLALRAGRSRDSCWLKASCCLPSGPRAACSSRFGPAARSCSSSPRGPTSSFSISRSIGACSGLRLPLV
jgi:hypothetical protein